MHVGSRLHLVCWSRSHLWHWVRRKAPGPKPSFGVGPRSLRRVLQYFLFLEPRHRERPPFLLPLRERCLLANLQPASGRGLDDRLSRRDIGATITRELSPRSGAELRRHRRVPGGRGARGAPDKLAAPPRPREVATWVEYLSALQQHQLAPRPTDLDRKTSTPCVGNGRRRVVPERRANRSRNFGLLRAAQSQTTHAASTGWSGHSLPVD